MEQVWYTMCESALKEFRVGTGLILKEGSFKKPANAVRTFGLACKAPQDLYWQREHSGQPSKIEFRR